MSLSLETQIMFSFEKCCYFSCRLSPWKTSTFPEIKIIVFRKSSCLKSIVYFNGLKQDKDELHKENNANDI